MANFSVAHDQSFAAVEECNRLSSKLKRQVREGAQNYGKNEIQKIAHNIGVSMKALSEALSLLSDQTQTLGWEQTGDVSQESLRLVSKQVFDLSKKLPQLPL